MGTKLMTEKEVAEQIGMSVHWMRKKRMTGGGIPFLKMSDSCHGAVRYEQGAVEAYKAGRERRSTCDEGSKKAA